MAKVTHTFTSPKADGPDATLVRPSNWNANHTINNFLPRGYLGGLGLTNGGDATNDIDIAVGECRDSTNVDDLVLAVALTKQSDAVWAVGTNAGGLDTGVVGNGTYHIWLIKRTDTAVVDALFSLSATAPTMPASYTEKRRIGSIVRTGGSIKAFKQYGDRFTWVVPVVDVSTTNPGTSAITETLTIPTGFQFEAVVSLGYTDTNSGGGFAWLSDLAITDTAAAVGIAQAGLGNALADQKNGWIGQVTASTAAQIRARVSSSGAATVLTIGTHGWIDRRGRDD